jgi:muramoyltetrapeptide carboxypeptidase
MQNKQLTPNVLKPGDTIAIIAPAKAANKEHLQLAQTIIQKRGYKVLLSPHIDKLYHQFAGTDSERAADLQWAVNHKDVRAVFCFRGGYGTYKILEKVDFSPIKSNPKWFVGFSDITSLQLYLYRHYRLVSLHAPMPVNYKNISTEAMDSVFAALENYTLKHQTNHHPLNVCGNANGILLGGNLSLIYSMTGSNDLPDFENCILFIEDLDEYLYHVDRMMLNLDKSGILKKISALIVGGMSSMKDNEIPFGKNAEEIIYEYFSKYDKPLCFNFPIGHIMDNRALIQGKFAELRINNLSTELIQ